MKNPRKIFIIGLLYPAIVGTVFVLIMLRISLHDDISSVSKDLSLYYGLLLLCMFSACFLEIERTENSVYNKKLFISDIVEVVLIFWAFYFLGLFNTDLISQPNLLYLYFVAIFTIVVQGIWGRIRGFHGNVMKFLLLRIFAIFLIISVIFLRYRFPVFDYLLYVFFSFSVICYLFVCIRKFEAVEEH